MGLWGGSRTGETLTAGGLPGKAEGGATVEDSTQMKNLSLKLGLERPPSPCRMTPSCTHSSSSARPSCLSFPWPNWWHRCHPIPTPQPAGGTRVEAGGHCAC